MRTRTTAIPIFLLAITMTIVLQTPQVARADDQAPSAMARGYAAIKSKDYKAANAAFLSVAESSPDSALVPEALLRLGGLQVKDTDQAVITFDSLVQRYPDSPQAVTALHRLGALHLRAHRYDDAQSALKRAAECKASALENRGSARLQYGFLDIMKCTSADYWGRGPSGDLVRVKEQSAEAKALHLSSAIQTFKSVRSEFAGSAHPEVAAVADAALGEIYLLGHLPRLAERAYWQVLRDHANTPAALVSIAHYGLAQARYAQADPEDALRELDAALDSFATGRVCGISMPRPKMLGELYVWKVQVLVDLDRADDALSAARTGRSLVGSSPEASSSCAKLMLWESSVLEATGRKDEAQQVLRLLVNKYPKAPQAPQALNSLSWLNGGTE